jgi:hypothetical protein
MRTSSIAVLTAMCAATALGSSGGECEHFKAMWFGPTTPAFDVGTGRNLKQYPSHRIVDAVSMRLELKIPDMNVPRMTGVQTLTVETIGPREVGEIVIDAVEMKIESIAANGHDVKFEHADGKLRIMFSPMLKAGSRTDIVTKSFDGSALDDGESGVARSPGADTHAGTAADKLILVPVPRFSERAIDDGDHR